MLRGDFFYLADQARDMTLVKDIVINHKLTLIGSHSGLGGLFHGPLWLYMLIPIFLIGQGNPFIFTYWYAAIPLVTVIAGFIVGRKLYGDLFAVFTAFFLGINSILWGYINNTIGINLMPLLFIAFIYPAVLYLRGNNKALIAAAFFAGLAFQFETASALALIPVVIFLTLLRPQIFREWKIIMYSIGAFVLSLASFILFDLRHQFLTLKSTLQLFNQNQGSKDYATLLQRFLDHLTSLKNTYTSIFFSQNTILLILGILIVGVFVYLFIYKRVEERKEFAFLFLSPLLVYLFYMLYPHPIYAEYVLDLTVSLIFALSLTFIRTWQTLLGKVLISFFVIISLGTAGQYLFTLYSQPYSVDTTSGSYINQKRVADWILEDTKNKPFGYFVYTPETFTYGMDYLFWWKSFSMHKSAPQSTKLAQTYLILYPPLANDTHAHIFWIKNTIHTNADVEEKKVFPGNITVEKMDLSHDTQEVDPNYYQNLIFR